MRIFHSMVAILILLAGGALLGLGIWMTVTGTGGPLNLNFSGQNFFNIVLSADIGAIVLGGFLLLTGLVSLIALLNECIGMTFRALYIVMASIILVALIIVTVIASLIVNNGDNKDIRSFVSKAWERTVESDPHVVCEIERKFNCRGFKDQDCILCKTGSEPECAATVLCAKCNSVSRPDPNVGCYPKIKNNIRHVFLPSAIVAGLLSAVVLVDVLLTCAL